MANTHSPAAWAFFAPNGQVRVWFGDEKSAINWAEINHIGPPERLYREASHQALIDALEPFAKYEQIRRTMGALTPRSGVIWGVNSIEGSAEITAEDMDAAIKALSKARETA